MGRLKNLFRRKENPAMQSVFSTLTPGQPIWTPKNYAALTEAGYENCAAVFACVSLIAKTASRIQFTLKDRKGNELEEHALLALLARPNSGESGIRFHEKLYSFLLLSGNSYIGRVHGFDSSPPKFLYTLRPDRMKVITGTWDQPVAGWEYRAGINAVTWPAEKVLQITEFNPLNDFYGLSRIQVAARQIDIANNSTAWNKSVLQNDMRPAGVLNFKVDLDPDQRDEIRKQVEYRSAGYENAGSFLITEGEATWTQMSMTAKDLDFLNGQKYNRREIAAIFNVPPELIGDSEAKTYSNFQEARKALYEEVVLPLMDILVAEYNAWLVPLFRAPGLRLGYDRDMIEALQEDRGKKYAYIAQADWLTVNEKRDATGYDELAEGDIVLVPISSIPLQEAGPGQRTGGPTADGDKMRQNAYERQIPQLQAAVRAVKKSFWTENRRREALWHAHDKRARAREKTYKQIQLKYMKAQAARFEKALEAFDTIGQVPLGQLFDVEKEAQFYQKEFGPWYVDAAIRAGQAGLGATKGEIVMVEEGKLLTSQTQLEIWRRKGDEWTFDLTPQREEILMRMVFNSGTKVNETTVDIIYDVLQASVRENATIEHFTQQIWEQVDWMSPERARLWAETETTKVENWGTVEGYKDSEFVERKGWNCQLINTSREEHVAADGQEVKLDDAFNVGGELLAHPGDPAGSAWNVCNCRCSTYPVVEPD